MVNFGKKLVQSQHPPWKEYYLDYNELKRILKDIIKGEGDFEFDALEAHHEDDGKAVFEVLLDRQIETVVIFFLQLQGKIAKNLAELRETKEKSQDMHAKYCGIGEEIILLVNYVELNVTALQKILKKHDKHFHRNPITKRFLAQHYRSEMDSHLQQLYHYEGIAALTETLRQGLLELEGGPIPSTTSCSSFRNSSLSKREKIEPILHKILAARRRLNQSSGYAVALAVQAMFFDRDSEDNESVHSSLRSNNRHELSGLLNLASTFLFMTNYFIVAPTSGSYAARLGMSEALAGVIIGMTPCAAMIASVLYSWWSNYSYKDALLFSAGCAILGDILYALALPFNSVTLILVGRLLNGFGGARAINRRYIADAYARNDRTAASAAFVTASALGMAVGPALAVAADILTPTNPVEAKWWTVETAPGWIMIFLWSTYFLICLFYFEEPERKEEGKKHEEVVTDKTPLLNGEMSVTKPVTGEVPLWKNIPAMTTLLIYFVLKLVLECLMSSTATITTYYFHWNVTRSGIFLAILGLIVFPANMAVAWLSRTYEDRAIIMGTQGIILVGNIGIISYCASYSVIQYIVFYVFIFLGANMLEGPNMALLSKTLPRRWASGTFNSGLLATEAGTFGRVVGDFLISAAGLVGLERVLNLTFVPTAVFVSVMLLVCWRLYPQLEEIEEDDE